MYNFSRIAIIKEKGDMDIIFSSKNNGCDNLLVLKKDEDVKRIYDYEETIKDDIFSNSKLERHIYYLRDYLKDHFIQEFNEIGLNPQKTNYDFLLYYYLKELGNVVIVNCGTRHNLLFVKREEMNKEQLESLCKISQIFKNDSWSIFENLHFEIEEKDGEKYKYLDDNEIIKSNINDYINGYKQ